MTKCIGPTPGLGQGYSRKPPRLQESCSLFKQQGLYCSQFPLNQHAFGMKQLKFKAFWGKKEKSNIDPNQKKKKIYLVPKGARSSICRKRPFKFLRCKENQSLAVNHLQKFRMILSGIHSPRVRAVSVIF